MMDDIRVQPTEAEIASLVMALPTQHALIVRRLAYQRDQLQAFIKRVHEECDKHIESRKSVGKVCGDCPVWTLRAEAAELVKE